LYSAINVQFFQLKYNLCIAQGIYNIKFI